MIGCCLPQLGQKYALLHEGLVNTQEYLHSSHLYSYCSNLIMPNQNAPIIFNNPIKTKTPDRAINIIAHLAFDCLFLFSIVQLYHNKCEITRKNIT